MGKLRSGVYQPDLALLAQRKREIMPLRAPRGLLFDYGGTLVEEVAVNLAAGTALMLERAAYRRPDVSLDAVLARADRVSTEVSGRRDQFGIETPWTSLNRLVHDFFGTRFNASPPELELAFWDATVTTRPMPGVRAALHELHRLGMPMGVVSNSSFSQHVLRHELEKHGLADHFAVEVASADYVVRKPNPMLFETEAALLGVGPADVWFVGDSYDHDVVGARAAGMTSVWFAPAGGDTRDADMVVRDWDDLVKEVVSR
jgi:putative hydrolase of the HAD superfamily